MIYLSQPIFQTQQPPGLPKDSSSLRMWGSAKGKTLNVSECHLPSLTHKEGREHILNKCGVVWVFRKRTPHVFYQINCMRHIHASYMLVMWTTQLCPRSSTITLQRIKILKVNEYPQKTKKIRCIKKWRKSNKDQETKRSPLKKNLC